MTDKVNIEETNIQYGHSCRRAEGCIAMDGRQLERFLYQVSGMDVRLNVSYEHV